MMHLISLGLLLITFSACASIGSEGVGGGDLCEDRIKIIRDDLNNWIKLDGPNGLALPIGMTVKQYSQAMLEKIISAKIKCVSDGDEGFPVSVNGVAKVCKFEFEENDGSITCDYNKFQTIKDADQYVLVHHEFAGLAKVELPNGSDSNYTVSNQISAYLENQVTKKLSIKKNISTKEDCAKFDPTKLKIINNSEVTSIRPWAIGQVLPGRTRLLSSFTSEDQAIDALRLIGDYGYTEHCFVGRPNPTFEYWK